MRGRNEKTIGIARTLRVNQTNAETVLWNRIRNRQIDGHKFVRQAPILGYICDFVCREQRLVIEVDGGQHNESAADVRSPLDGRRVQSAEGLEQRRSRKYGRRVLINIQAELLK
jgi:very-short-patch-repair endonuclease